MMRAVKAGRPCLAAVVALFALTASSALAEDLPHFGKCEAQTGGKFKTASCTKLAKTSTEEKFEWHPLTTTVAFTSKKQKETGKAVLEAANGNEISCTEQREKEGRYGPGARV